MAAFHLDLSSQRLRHTFRALAVVNLTLAATTTLFILAWTRLAELPGSVQMLVNIVLVQGHLATENNLAAWYSSMLLLVIGVAALLALHADLRRATGVMPWGWALVATAFTGLSLDEIGSFHERLGMLHALSPSGDRAVGWVYALAVPIGAVALFLLAFAWFHVRRAPRAFLWMAAGVLLFTADPLFEAWEMALIHGPGREPGTWARTLHDTLVVLEEGGLELFGVLCFLMAVLRYLQFAGGDRPIWTIDDRRLRFTIRSTTALAALGVVVATKIVNRLPPADTGIPANWFPAAMFLLVALAGWMIDRKGQRTPLVLVACAAIASAFCGAGLYGYSRVLDYGAPHVAVIAVIVAGWTLEGTATAVPSTGGA